MLSSLLFELLVAISPPVAAPPGSTRGDPPPPSFGAAGASLEAEVPEEAEETRTEAASEAAVTDSAASSPAEAPPADPGPTAAAGTVGPTPVLERSAPAEQPKPPEILQPPSPTSEAARPRAQRARAQRDASVWGDTWITGTISAGRRIFGFGAEGTRFLVPFFGVGLALHNQIGFPPGEPAVNLFTVTPLATVLLLPRRRFTPIVRGGFGGAFFNRGGGAYGRWVGGVSFAFAPGEHLVLEVGFEVDGLVPDDKFEERFQCGASEQVCSLALVPQAGIGWRM